MKNIIKYWPLLVSLAVAYLNVDFVIIPILRGCGIRGLNLFFLSSSFAVIEQGYWYWFWGWLIGLAIHSKPVTEDIEFGRGLFKRLKEEGIISIILGYFYNKYHWLLNSNHRIVRWIKRGGYLSSFIAGLTPERAIGVIICRSMNSKKGFCSLALGNVLHVGYMTGAWDLFFRLFKN